MGRGNGASMVVQSFGPPLSVVSTELLRLATISGLFRTFGADQGA